MGGKLRAASGDGSDRAIDLFEAMGGTAKCRELSAVFYARVARDATLRPLFPGKTLRCAIEEFAAFLVQFLGGPAEDTQKRWWLSLRESHGRFAIGQKQRDAWMACMREALVEVELSESMRGALRELFAEASAYVVNSGAAVPAAEGRAEAPEFHAQMARLWEEQRRLDEAVAAVRAGDLERVAAMLASPGMQACLQGRRAVFAQFVGLLIGSWKREMVEYAKAIVLENPDLAHEFYGGRTLLHAAAAAGSVAVVEAILRQGVDAEVQDRGGHTALYCVGNECGGGGDVVKVLVRAGARVDACDGVKRCTALHMAARRGNVEAAEALLSCGANIEARDSLGETPLRRAVNCGKVEVAKLLLEKGADRHCVGSKGLTPVSAARSGAMRELLQRRAAR